MTVAAYTAFPHSAGSKPVAGDGNAASTGSSVDFGFWRKVFDDANLQGMHTQAQLPDDQNASPQQPPQQTSAGVGKDAQAEQGAGALAMELQGQAAPASLRQAHQVDSRSNPGLRDAMLIVGGQVFRQHASGAQASMSTYAAHDTNAASEHHLASAPQATPMNSAETPTLHAQVMQTASGDWKVVLRSQRVLSDAQALSAVADALMQDGMPRGRVEQVILNGRSIYQQTGQMGRQGASAAIVFELQC